MFSISLQIIRLTQSDAMHSSILHVSTGVKGRARHLAGSSDTNLLKEKFKKNARVDLLYS